MTWHYLLGTLFCGGPLLVAVVLSAVAVFKLAGWKGVLEMFAVSLLTLFSMYLGWTLLNW